MNTSIENIVYTEFTKKKVFEQLTLAVACCAGRHHGSRDILGDQQSKHLHLGHLADHVVQSDFTLSTFVTRKKPQHITSNKVRKIRNNFQDYV